jgi:CCR4-NOT transcription complex subunit 6
MNILRKSPIADIICLQEVDVHWFEKDIFLPGYTPIVQNVTRGHSVGCAILVNDAKFQVLKTESRSRALMVVLQEKINNSSSKNLFLANVHLEAGTDEDETRFCQIKSLLKRLKNQWTTLSSPSSTSASVTGADHSVNPAIMIVGDFNMLDNNPLFHLLSHGDWNPKDANNFAQTFAFKKQLPFLPLKETFHGTGQRLGMSFAGGSVLDYIWHSDQILTQPWIVDAKVMAPGLRQAWPSREHPSDHLPIGADFSFR